MELIKNTKIDFIGKRYIFFLVSGILTLAGIVSLVAKGGPNLGIDFTGGLLMQLSFNQAVDLNQVRSALGEIGLTDLEMQSAQGNNVIVRMKQQDIPVEETAAKVRTVLAAKFSQMQPDIVRKEFVGPAVGRQLFKQAMFAIVFSLLGIIIYVAFRFHSGIWGVAGVIALAHDVFVVFGMFSIFNKEINLTVVAALLTIAGYSINDTIVVFDRMRENLKLMVKMDLGTIINLSINQTLSRTLITSATVFFIVTSLYFLGGVVIHEFALAMLMGVVIGTYSSVWVAAPMVYEWEIYKKKKALRSKLVK